MPSIPWARRRAAARAVALLALAAALIAPSAASAHARLESTAPKADAALDRAPATVTLHFDEAVETAFGAVRVVDAHGRRVDDAKLAHPRGAANLSVGLRRGLAKGTYTVAWRVVSDEGHPVSGAYVFQIGHGRRGAAATLTAATGSGPGTERAYAMTRTAGYLAMALGLGTLLFLLACWLPALREAAGAESCWREAADRVTARWRALWLGAVVFGALGAVCGLVLQAATSGGMSVVAALDPSVLHEVLATRAGRAWVARALAWLVVAGVVELAARRGHAMPRLRHVALGSDGWVLAAPSRGSVTALAAAAGLLVATPALAGHAAAQSPAALLVPMAVVHIAAMCAWLGGLVAIATLLPCAARGLEPRERAQLRAGVLDRFSPLAFAAVVALAATGLAQAAMHLRRLDALTTTAYGRELLAKAILLLALVGLGALNRQRTLPRLRAVAAGQLPTGRATRALRATVRCEIALLVAVLTVTGALVGTATPATRAASPGHVERSASMGAADLDLSVAPARPGINRIELYLFNTINGLPYRDTHHVTVIATPPGAGTTPISFDATEVGTGHYDAASAPLTIAGTWRLHVTNRMPGMPEDAATVDVPIR